MTNNNSVKMPVLKAILYTLLILVFPVGAGVVATIFELNDTLASLVQAVFLQGQPCAGC